MAYDDFTRHQQGIIKRYYRNAGAIHSQKLAELVTELYLAEGKKLDRLWTQVQALLVKLELPTSRVEHLTSRRDPSLLAALIKELDADARR